MTDIETLAMATGTGFSKRQVDSLTCALCLEVYTKPKLLPCSHTFCKKCLKKLAYSRLACSFPCPVCRKTIELPPGGVADFQNNFYLDPDDLEKARYSLFCSLHPKRELELFCKDCDVPVCYKCKVKSHGTHTTKDLQETAVSVSREKRAVADKTKAMRQAIFNKEAILKAAVEKFRDDALATLDDIADAIDEELSGQRLAVPTTPDAMGGGNISRHQSHAMPDAVNKGTFHHHQTARASDANEDIRFHYENDGDSLGDALFSYSRTKPASAHSRAGRVRPTATHWVKSIQRPVLRFSSTPEASLQQIKEFIGGAVRMEFDLTAPEVTVVEQFRYDNDPDTDVSEVSPLSDGKVWLSYESYSLRGAWAEKFDRDGKVVNTIKCNNPGRISFVGRKDGKDMYMEPNILSLRTYAKKCDTELVSFYRLDKNVSLPATVWLEKITSEYPLRTEESKFMAINCGTYLAFDVDSSEEFFVVVEEGKTPDFQHRVQLYRRPEPDAIATYSPPVTPFRPSDVCFYMLGDEEVLLVADELNDAIHVVKVQDGHLSFLRYLAPGCPLLVQPTALNTDTRGRLWVACRGGRILTCTPFSK